MTEHYRTGTQRFRGFTIIEMMIAVAIIGILAAIALPAYQEYVRVARRADALDALSAASTAQEKYRVNNSSYATALSALTSPVTGLSLTSASPNGYYTISVSGTPTASTYSFAATAVPSGPQASDTACTTITINQTGTISPTACAKR